MSYLANDVRVRGYRNRDWLAYPATLTGSANGPATANWVRSRSSRHVHAGRVPVNGRIQHNHPELLIDGSDRYADRLRGYQSILRIFAEVSVDQHPLFMIFTCL